MSILIPDHVDFNIIFFFRYDNEWSYASQMIHMARTVAEVTAPRRVRSIRDVPSFSGRAVFLRVDFNCPLSDDGSVADNFRVRAALHTLQHILRDKPKRVVIASHLGRPTAEKRDPNFSMARFVPILASLLREAELDKAKGKKTECHESGSTESFSSSSCREVHFVTSGLNATEEELSVGGEGAIYLLENVRFHAFETKPVKKEGEGANFFACQFQVDVRLLRILQNIYMRTSPTYSIPNSFFPSNFGRSSVTKPSPFPTGNILL